MKLTIPRSDLTKALGLVRSVAGGSSLPILGNVAISALSTHLELTCTDLDIYIRTTVAAGVTEKGECTVNAGLFFNIVNALTGEAVEVEQANDTLTIKSGSSKYNLGSHRGPDVD